MKTSISYISKKNKQVVVVVADRRVTWRNALLFTSCNKNLVLRHPLCNYNSRFCDNEYTIRLFRIPFVDSYYD
jgi:hypothetical protein